MRMWILPTWILCRQHLLGEHKELHMIEGCIRSLKNLDGYINKGWIAIPLIEARHEQLVAEMISRGYKHKSPLVLHSNKYSNVNNINMDFNLADLLGRCHKCRERFRGKQC